MRAKEHVKREILAAIDRRAEQIVSLGEQIRRNPELGFKEVKTARLVEETFAGLGLAPKTGLALTGVRAEARGTKDGPTLENQAPGWGAPPPGPSPRRGRLPPAATTPRSPDCSAPPWASWASKRWRPWRGASSSSPSRRRRTATARGGGAG